MRTVFPRVMLGVCLVLVASAAWSAVGADGQDDPRNRSQEHFEAQNGARCFSCHTDAGFDPMQVALVERYREIPVGETEVLALRVRHVSPMAHVVQDLAVTVDLSEAPNVVVVDDDFTEDLRVQETHTMAAGDVLRTRVNVSVGAARLHVSLRAVGAETLDPLDAGEGELSLVAKTESGKEYPSDGSRMERVIAAEGDALRGMEKGTYFLEAAWDSTVDQTMEAVLVIEVDYAHEATEHTFRLPGVRLRSGDAATFEIPIRMTAAGPARLDFRVASVSYFEHLATSANPRNDGLYYRFTTMEVTGGDEVVKTTSSVAPVPVAPAVDLYNLFARIVGFVTLVLVPVALLTGGVFGKGSRRAMNRAVGGPKRRVLWHMSMSWAIIAFACAHFVLALLEAQFAWSKGLFWGGVAWAALVSLGFTGYYQRAIIKRWGYRPWRHVHLWPAVGVLAFGVLHMVVDGSDLAALRGLLPGADGLSWP